MSEWRDCKLGDLLGIKHGYAFLGEHFGDTGTHIVLTPGNFYDEGGFKDKGDKEKWYSGPVPTEYVLQEGDLIIAMTEQAEGLLGSSAIVPRSGVYLHNQRLGLVQLRDESKTDQRFVYYIFNSKTVRQQIRASASGAKIRHTAPSRIANVKVRVPPVRYQRRIAEILSAYDDLIENNLRRIRILEEMARAIYHEWLVEFRFPGHHKNSRVRSMAGDIPADWVIRRLDEVAEIKGGRQLEKEDIRAVGKFPVFGGNGIQGYSERATHKGFVIAFGRVGAYCGSIHWSYDGAWLNNNSSSIVPLRHDELVLHHLLDFNFTNLRGGAAQPFISNAALASIQVIFPSDALAEKFCLLIKPLRLQQALLEKQTTNLRRNRDLLMPRLLSGAVAVALE